MGLGVLAGASQELAGHKGKQAQENTRARGLGLAAKAFLAARAQGHKGGINFELQHRARLPGPAPELPNVTQSQDMLLE